MSEFRKTISELKKLTQKEREYMLELLRNRSDKNVDLRRLEFDCELYRFSDKQRMRRLFDMMYGLSDEEIEKLYRMFMR